MTKIFILLVLIATLSGCINVDDYLININVSSSSQCVLGCKTIMEDSRCMSVTPTYKEQIKNNELQSASCECILLDCFKEVDARGVKQ